MFLMFIEKTEAQQFLAPQLKKTEKLTIATMMIAVLYNVVLIQ